MPTPHYINAKLLLAAFAAFITPAELNAQTRAESAQPNLRPVFGKVVDAAGSPVEGAEVHGILPDDAGLGQRAAATFVVTTDKRGRFRAKICPGTRHLVWAIGPGNSERGCSRAVWTNSGRQVELQLGKTRPACSLSVRNLEPWQDLAPFRLRFAVDGVAIPEIEMQLDPESSCELPFLPAGSVQIEVIDKNGETLCLKYIRGRETDSISVAPPQEVPMRAVDGDGQPLAGATVRARLTGYGYRGQSYTYAVSPPSPVLWRVLGVTGEDGRLIGRISSDQNPFYGRRELMFVAEKKGHKTTYSGFSQGPYFDGRQIGTTGCTELTFTLPKADLHTGRVLLDEQRGLANQQVTLRLDIRVEFHDDSGWLHDELILRSRTDANGVFRFPQLQGKINNIDVLLTGRQPRAMLIPQALQRSAPRRAVVLHSMEQPDAEQMTFRVDKMKTIEVQVLDELGGPARNVELMLISFENRESGFCNNVTMRATTDSAGRCAMLVQQGKWFLFGRNARHMVQLSFDVDDHQRHQLRLEPMPFMHGRIVDADEQPIGGAKLSVKRSRRSSGGKPTGLEVIANSLNSRWISRTRSDENGQFFCAYIDLPSHDYTVCFQTDQRSSQRFKLEAHPDPITVTIEN